jgi:hypothetical protein
LPAANSAQGFAILILINVAASTAEFIIIILIEQVRNTPVLTRNMRCLANFPFEYLNAETASHGNSGISA